MKAAILRSFGAAPAVEEVPLPAAGEGEVELAVTAAAVHPIVKALASGKHYASPKQLPVVCGLDGAGRLADGTRVYFGPMGALHGSIAERVVVERARCAPIPEGLDDATAAALINPGLAAWLPLTWRARLQPGEPVCILGATGTAGKLAVRSARLLGAGRIVAAGRDPQTLQQLAALGADAVVALDGDPAGWADAFGRAAGPGGFAVVVDYLWGAPTEALLACLARAKPANEIRLVQVGESAGPSVRLSGGLLRGTGLTITGFGLRAYGVAPRAYGIAPPEVFARGFAELTGHAARGAISIEVERIALDQLPAAWAGAGRRSRLVVTP